MYRMRLVAGPFWNEGDALKRMQACTEERPFGLEMTLSIQVGGSGCPQRASMKRIPFCAVFKVWPSFRIELRNLARLVARPGAPAAELDADIARLELTVRG